MPIEVELPDGRIAEFPDGTPQDEMLRAIKQQEQLSWSDVPGKAWDNLVPSASRAASDVVEAFRHPIDTATTLGKTAAGFVPGLNEIVPDAKQHAESFSDYFGTRYGSIEGLKRALSYDPVGVLSDLSTFATGGAGALRGLAKGASIAGKAGAAANLGRAADWAGTAARVADPLTAAMLPLKGVGYGLDKFHGGTTLPERLYGSALRLPLKKDFTLADRKRVIRTGLNEGILPTYSGMDKIDAIVANLNKKISDAINAGAGEGKSINPRVIADKAFDETTRNFLGVNPDADISAIASTIDGFEKWHGANNIPLDAAQKLKQTTYKTLKSKAYNGELKTAGVEAEKALARGLKEGIAELAPEVAPLNARESRLLELSGPLQNAVGRYNNTDLFSLPALASGGLGGMIGGPTGAGTLSGTVQLSRVPAIKAGGAITIDRLEKLLGKPASFISSYRRPVTAAGYAGQRINETFQQKLNRLGIRTSLDK